MAELNLFWDAVSAFQIPTNKSDPVAAYGWDRNSNYFKDIQFAYAQQNVDTYRLGSWQPENPIRVLLTIVQVIVSASLLSNRILMTLRTGQFNLEVKRIRLKSSQAR